jgi:hypothetical protein
MAMNSGKLAAFDGASIIAHFGPGSNTKVFLL